MALGPFVEEIQEPPCTEGKTCPRVADDPDPTMAVVQGYIPDDQPFERLAPPAGESLVRAPRKLLIKAGRELELDDLFDSATVSAFRLETLPQYLVDQEAEWLEAFRRERTVPKRTTESSVWLRYVAETTA